MTYLSFSLVALTAAFGAGILGAMLGLGGGIIIVPFLTLFMGIDIHHAIGASIVSVIATSSGAALAHLNSGFTNLRVGTLLNLATTTGAITGAFLMGWANPDALYLLFGAMLGYSGLAMVRQRSARDSGVLPNDPLAVRLGCEGQYLEPSTQQQVRYRATRIPAGLTVMYVAGVVSGILGIGSGVLKVLGMDMVMGLPIKVSSATSNFMIGVTAAASAGVFLARGDIRPEIAAPIALGVLCGSLVGSRFMARLRNRTLRLIFVPVLLIVSAQMLFKAGVGFFG